MIARGDRSEDVLEGTSSERDRGAGTNETRGTGVSVKNLVVIRQQHSLHLAKLMSAENGFAAPAL